MGDLDALARELVEAGMPWLPGVLWRRTDRHGGRIGGSPDDYARVGVGTPDLTDRATVGALFLGELSRRRKGASLVERDGLWTCSWHEPDAICFETASTPGEAVGRALLAVLRGGS